MPLDLHNLRLPIDDIKNNFNSVFVLDSVEYRQTGDVQSGISCSLEFGEIKYVEPSRLAGNQSLKSVQAETV